MTASPLGDAYFLHWGVVQISLANLIVIALMVAVFVTAVLVQLPRGERNVEDDDVHR